MKHSIPQPRSTLYQQEAEAYRSRLITLGYSQSGIRAKYVALLEFFARLEAQGLHELKQVQPPDIIAHYQYLKKRGSCKNGMPLQPKTLHEHMWAIQFYFSGLQSQGLLALNPASSIRFSYPKQAQPNQRVTLSRAEISSLYRHSISEQERAILSLAYGCGLRSGELQGLNISDIRFRERILILPKAKGNKRRIVPMSSRIIQDLSSYFFQERPALCAGKDYQRHDPAFMLHSRGGRMRRYTYNKYLQRIIARTGNSTLEGKAISIHNLRHTIATHLLEKGVPLEQVRDFLGHSQLETTQIYTHISQKHLKKIKR
jgi:integrase/recombinase XerD